MKREFWKVYAASGQIVATCFTPAAAGYVKAGFPGSFVLKVRVEDESWEALARSMLS